MANILPVLAFAYHTLFVTAQRICTVAIVNINKMQTVALNTNISGNSNNPPMIIMHGLFGSSRNWSQLAEKFAEQFQVFAVDLRNHGGSPHVQHMDYPAMAADLCELMTVHNMQNATVLGHSLGGKVAMWLALTQPNCVQKLIVVDIAPEQYPHHFSEIFRAIQSVPLQDIASRTQADTYLAIHIGDQSVRQFILQNLVNREGRYSWRIPFNYLEQATPEIMGFPDTNQVKPYTQSALFIGGGRSDYLLTKHHKIIHSLFPQYQIETIENAGHWVHAEQPQQLFDIIDKFCVQT